MVGRQRVGVQKNHGFHEIGMVRGDTSGRKRAARVAHQRNLLRSYAAQKSVDVLDGFRHRIVPIAVGIVGVALSDLVKRQDAEMRGQVVEVQAPVIRVVIGAEVSAVDEDQRVTLTRLEIAGFNSIDVDKLGIFHGFSP